MIYMSNGEPYGFIFKFMSFVVPSRLFGAAKKNNETKKGRVLALANVFETYLYISVHICAPTGQAVALKVWSCSCLYQCNVHPYLSHSFMCERLIRQYRSKFFLRPELQKGPKVKSMSDR